MITLDFRYIVLDGKKKCIFLGTNYHGQLRHFELLDGNSTELKALQSSLWYQKLADPNEPVK